MFKVENFLAQSLPAWGVKQNLIDPAGENKSKIVNLHPAWRHLPEKS